MKKSLVIGVAAVLTAGSFTPTVFADASVQDANQTQQTKTANNASNNDTSGNQSEQENSSESDASSESAVNEEGLIDILTLEQAIQTGLEGNYSLMELNYALQNAEIQLESSVNSYEDTVQDIEDLSDQLEDLENFTERRLTDEQRDALAETLETMDDTIKQLASTNKVLQYNQEEAEKTIVMTIISNYVGLVMQENQLDMMNESLENQLINLQNLATQYELGAISANEYQNAAQDVETQRATIATAEEQLENDTEVFAMNIGIAYHSDLSLAPPEVDMSNVNQEISTEELVANSYAMKTAEENLSNARTQFEETLKNDDTDSYAEEQAMVDVRTEELNVERQQRDLSIAVEDLYNQLDLQYQAVNDANRELQYAQDDFETQRTLYEAGVISEQDYQQSEIMVDQAENTVETEKYSYYLLTKQEELMREGVIQTTTL